MIAEGVETGSHDRAWPKDVSFGIGARWVRLLAAQPSYPCLSVVMWWSSRLAFPPCYINSVAFEISLWPKLFGALPFVAVNRCDSVLIGRGWRHLPATCLAQ